MSSSRAVLSLAFLSLAFAVPAAVAESPDPRFSTCDLILVGNVSGTPLGSAPAGFDVVVRDVNNAPLPGRVVTIDFGSSAMKVFAVQNAGITLDCAARTISRVTNAQGAVNIGARVAGYDNTNAVLVLENGNLLAKVKGRSTDIDGADGTTGLGDFAIFGDNFLNHSEAQETDFDLDGRTGLGDYAVFGAEFLRGAVHPYCP